MERTVNWLCTRKVIADHSQRGFFYPLQLELHAESLHKHTHHHCCRHCSLRCGHNSRTQVLGALQKCVLNQWFRFLPCTHSRNFHQHPQNVECAFQKWKQKWRPFLCPRPIPGHLSFDKLPSFIFLLSFPSHQNNILIENKVQTS